MAHDDNDEPESLHCSNCGAQLHIKSTDNEFVTCDYCGSTYGVVDLLHSDAEPVRQRQERQEKQSDKTDERTAAATKRVNFIFRLIGLAVIIPLVVSCVGYVVSDATGGSYSTTYEPYSWDDLTLGSHLPEFEGKAAHIYDNSSEELDIEFPDVDEDACRAYIATCREAGYTVEQEYTDDALNAFDDEGYHLNLYRISNGQMQVQLNAPWPMDALAWPSSTIAGLLPEPDAERGYVRAAGHDRFTAYIDGMSLDEVNDYIQQCVDAGFNQEQGRQGGCLWAENADGVRLNVSYEGNNVMCINMYKYE